MLDECKGEKFEEVLSAFATTVLRKIARAKNDAHLELSCLDRLSSQQREQILPLIIAHRSLLQQQLSKRREIQKHAEVYNGILAQRHASIDARRALFGTLPALEQQQIPGLCQAIADAWVGDERWAEILVSGAARSNDTFLEAPFETGWKAVLEGQNVDISNQGNLLEDLNVRIANQEARLRKWKNFADSLRDTEGPRSQAPPAPDSSETPNSAMLQFDRHQSLHLSDKSLSARYVDQHAPMAFIHKTLLDSMKAEIANLGRRKPVISIRDQQGHGPGYPQLH